jgi:carbon-monoxide dehydrogenase medium subunit
MKAACFDYLRPDSVEQAVRALAAGAGMGKVLGGGQSLGPMMNLRLAQPDQLIDLGGIAVLGECREQEDVVVLGAATTHAAIEDGRVPDPSRGLMPFVARGIAYRAVRNRGTLGGSLAHADPAADWINTMAVLDATCTVAGPAGIREVGQAEWMPGAFTTALSEDEVLVSVRIPKLSAAARWSYYKVQRKTGEFAEAIAAMVVDPSRGVCRAVIGAIDGAPHIVHDASPLIDRWDADWVGAQLRAAGLQPDGYEFQVHAVALRRAADAIAMFPGSTA